MKERKDKTIKNAISTLATTMGKNFSPAIIYGNVNITGSSAGGIVRRQAISPRRYMSQNELASYWKPTGSRLPWLREHMYLYNSSPKV
jgi:hypothetical protein